MALKKTTIKFANKVYTEFKQIKDFEDYAITTEGKVISFKYREPRIMSTWFQASGYENIKLCKNNTTTHKLVHRL